MKRIKIKEAWDNWLLEHYKEYQGKYDNFDVHKKIRINRHKKKENEHTNIFKCWYTHNRDKTEQKLRNSM